MHNDEYGYRVGYKQPPLHTRFRKGQSGNPEGGRRHKKKDKQHNKLLAELLQEALDRRDDDASAQPPRNGTQREAIVLSLIEKSARGDLRAIKLLLDIVPKHELVAPITEEEGEDARETIKRALDRIAARQAKLAENTNAAAGAVTTSSAPTADENPGEV